MSWVDSVVDSRLVYVGPHRVSAALEVSVVPGFAIEQLVEEVARLRGRILSTGVFTDVSVTIVSRPAGGGAAP